MNKIVFLYNNKNYFNDFVFVPTEADADRLKELQDMFAS